MNSTSKGATRQASAFADAKDTSRSAQAFTPIEIGLLGRLRAKRRPPPTQKAFFSVGAGRPLAEGLWRPNSFGAQAAHWPKAS
jgi:hypothetical protein